MSHISACHDASIQGDIVVSPAGRKSILAITLSNAARSFTFSIHFQVNKCDSYTVSSVTLLDTSISIKIVMCFVRNEHSMASVL